MQTATALSEVPNGPAVYALLGGRGAARSIAYVGVADKLRQRIRQHLVTRDSSVATGTHVVSLNAELVTEVAWWEYRAFAERSRLEAAELVAFDVLEPTLRSRGAIQADARTWYQDAAYNTAMHTLFESEPTGRLTIPTLQDALEHIADLERRIALLEAKLAGQEDGTAEP
jgi:hypothetical protein